MFLVNSLKVFRFSCCFPYYVVIITMTFYIIEYLLSKNFRGRCGIISMSNLFKGDPNSSREG